MDGWQSVKLGDALLVLRNGLNCKQNKGGAGEKISRIESIADARFDTNRVGFAEISEKEKIRYRLEKGDILFSHINSVPHVGKTALFDTDEEVYHGVNLLLMRPKPGIDSAYLDLYLKFIFLSGYWRTICKQSVNQASVNQQHIKVAPFRYPPLEEQKRIVAILDESFAGIDQAIKNTEKNLQNARELFESYLNGVFEKKGEGWIVRQIRDVAVANYGYTAKASFEQVGPKFLRITDIRRQSVSWDNVPNCVINAKDHAKHKLHTGDIVFARTGATTGKSFLVKNPPDAVCASYLIRLSLRDSKLLMPEFLILYFQTKSYWEKIGLGISGSAQGGFNASKLSLLSVPIPPKPVQDEIVKQAHDLMNESSRFEANCRIKEEHLGNLKQSILQKAFTGELTSKPEQVLRKAVG